MTTTRKPRLAWRREPRKTGMWGAMHNHERGWELRYGRTGVARVANPRGAGWYWVAADDALGIPWCNTAAEGMRIATLAEAKAQATEYVRGCLARKEESRE